MRRGFLNALFGWLGLTMALPAGVYGPAEKDLLAPVVEKDGTVKPLPPGLLRDTLDEAFGVLALQQALDQKVEPDARIAAKVKEKQAHYHTRAEALQAKVRSGGATLDDRLNLSAYLLWLGKSAAVIDLLEPLARGEARSHALVLANLSSAYQQVGQLERASDYLEQARDCWPQEYPGYTAEQLRWFAEVDKVQLRLLRARRLEAAQARPGTRTAAESVDALFGDRANPVRYVGEDGQYAAGTVAAQEKAKLPQDALALVQQLVLWSPTDTRLYWQLGELLNAQGPSYVPDAYAVLDACVYVRTYNSAELKDHRRVLLENLPKPTPPPAPTSWIPATSKLLAVGGVALAAIGVLMYFQVRELRRRRA